MSEIRNKVTHQELDLVTRERDSLKSQLADAKAENAPLKASVKSLREDIGDLSDKYEKIKEAYNVLARDSTALGSKRLDQLFASQRECDNLRSENSRLREALELIADKAPWCECMDAPGIAREALRCGDPK